MTHLADAELDATLEDVFRRSSASLVASLTRALGASRLDLVETVVQEAFARAMEEWPRGVPESPAGWLSSVAKNLALDHVRRERSLADKETAIAHFVETASATASPGADATLRGELGDAQLAMMFVACHPCNTVPSQVALALRTLSGFDARSIARALYATEDAIEKRLVLARRRIREAGLELELPPPRSLSERLDAVLRVLYLVFNEAYWATTGPDAVQEDVAEEAIRLTTFLADHATTSCPRVLALLALMQFHAARFPARRSSNGEVITLAEQDRSLWSEPRIETGLRLLAASAEGDPSPYHFEAAIAATHASAATYAATDWPRIVDFYDALLALEASPSARLSRAIALGYRDSPARGLEALDDLLDDEALASLAAYHAARADALERSGDRARARAAIETARAASTIEHEQRWLDKRLEQLRV